MAFRRTQRLRFLTLFICAAVFSLAAFGQANSSIIGTLADQGDAVIPGATVTVTEAATGVTRTAQANEVGLFRVLNLLPGRYTVRVEAKGFKTLEIGDIVLASLEARDLGRLRLAIGTLSEQVTVTAEATPVQTASSERSATVDGNQLNDVALKGRDTFGYMMLIPGVVDMSTDRSLAGPGSVANISINGMTSQSKNVTFDGVNQVDMGASNSVYVNPSMDAVAEIRVLTNGFQAEYGRNAGGVINMVTKSGTRDFRGTAYWQRRHEGMNANTFFNNRSNIQRPLYRYFIGGGTIGGPIYIPKVFNVEKQKLFFFWSEEFTRVAQPTQTSTANLPTVAERAGDFSDSRNAAGSVITIKDPTTGAPFAGNQIPLNRIDATGQKFLNLFLKPNGYVNPAPGQRYTANFLASATPYYRRRDDIVRIDYNPTSKMLVYGRWGHDLSDTLNVFTVSPGVGPLLNQLPGWNISTHVVNTISPTLVNDLNIGIGRNAYLWLRAEGDKDSNYHRTPDFNPPTLRPFPTGELYQPYLPAANYAGGSVSNPGSFMPYARFGLFPIPYTNYNRTYSVQDDVTKVYGSHSFKAGGYWELNSKSEPAFGAGYPGTFNFGSSTNNPLDTNHGYANALLGIFQTYAEPTKRLNPKSVFRQMEAYVQDNWRVNQRITVDLGVRIYKVGLPYDTAEEKTYAHFYAQLWKAADAARIYRPATVGGKTVALDPLTGATTYAALQSTLVPGSGSAVNGIRVNGLTGKGDFADLPFLVASPRLGLAFDLRGNGKTAIRASLGTFYTRPDANWLPGRGTAPTTFTQTVYYTTIGQIPDAAAAAAVSPVSASSIQGRQKVPRAAQVNLTVQQAVGFGTVVDVGYVGNFNRHAPVSRLINPVPRGAYADPNNLFNGTALNANLLRQPYTGMGSITYQANAISDLNYHGLQINAQRRMSRGLQYGASYVFSKALGTQGSDPYNVDRVWYYGPLTQDRRHVANFNWVYQVPSVGSNRYAKAVLGNWTLSGIATVQTGAPTTPSCSAVSGPVSVTDPPLTGMTARCKVVGDP
jgi:hypothetical protein